MKRKFFLIISLCVLTGCTQAKQLAHLDQMLALKEMSENGDEKEKFVEAQNKRFEQLLEVVKADRLKEYPDKKSIVKAFGEPVIVREAMNNGQPAEECLYRYATQYFKSEKVYIYFDDQGRLIGFEHIAASPEVVASEARNAGNLAAPIKEENPHE